MNDEPTDDSLWELTRRLWLTRRAVDHIDFGLDKRTNERSIDRSNQSDPIDR